MFPIHNILDLGNTRMMHGILLYENTKNITSIVESRLLL